MVWTRKASNEPSTKYEFLNLPGFEESVCFAPRYVESTNELFFCDTQPVNSSSKEAYVDLFVAKDFTPQVRGVRR
jgi:hypothetical protein